MVFDSLRDFIRPDRDRPAIVVDSVTETFRLYEERPTGIRERLTGFSKPSYRDFHALEDVSFTIEHGQTTGIIGHNGSGKSTLLKVLARILPPDEGRVEINGRVASLLELGAGFHGDLSGRENIYLNGAILGLTRAEIDEKFDDIVEFAGVRQFLDTAVRNYSSGMYVRLGFAIAVNVEPDILLVDEVLSVGDASFQAKSLSRMRQFQESGKTIVIVSHDLSAIQELCDRIIVLERGKILFDGNAREGVALYEQITSTEREEEIDPGQFGRGPVRIADVQLLDYSGRPATTVWPSSQLTLRVAVVADEPAEACSIGMHIATGDGRPLYETHSAWQGIGVGPLVPGQTAAVDLKFTAHLLAGHYAISAVATETSGRRTYASAPDVLSFEVQPAPGGAGLVDLVASASVAEGPALRLGPGSEGTGPIPVVDGPRLRPVDDDDDDQRSASGT